MRTIILIQVCVITFFMGCSNEDDDQFIASGIIEGTAVNVPAETGGRLLEIYVDEGDEVTMGQVIAVVDTEKLSYQLQQVEAGLEELAVQENINQNAYEKAKLDFEHIETKYKRFQELYEKNSASKQTLDDLKNAYNAAKTQSEIAQQNLRVVKSKQKSLEAQRKLLQTRIEDATIVAPFSGTVTTQYFEKGEMVPTGGAVVELIDLDQMWTKVYVSELILPKIKIAQPAEIRIDGTDRTTTGRVSWISSKAEFTPKNILTEESRTSLVYAVKVETENRDRVLKHGMPVEIALNLETVIENTN
ncbi:efflux RND transporter periplasmic adaptor subunit [candidate division KSB1 bacterium]|nr:efflux RND transporter periplasmic adaptor subunit [candidate division KSB1 bacterium]NIR71950.1 efflux RND transporter periplasmic adaptor subunit [candidate division KSB1 bacterium]NIS28018.1 efflux RND transporter periplasmic adaptor subunit [candidate division KSB1 bacterium]NIT74886.1 efflux RND transporter periplasmic adaptor subunit [candidate division KSB1 bacterium]NIU28670.1 efflux RND transporter periplasmic adaptor subunit [candidate division KSB1 bacterium]